MLEDDNERGLYPVIPDEQDERLANDLRLMYGIYSQDGEEAQRLARMRERLLQYRDGTLADFSSAMQQPSAPTRKQERLPIMSITHSIHPASQKTTWRHSISIVAAVLITALLVGSLSFLLLSHTHGSRTGASQTPHSNSVISITRGSWALTGSMQSARAFHTATLLANGKVLVAGGMDQSNAVPLNSAELYDPTTGTWSVTSNMNVARAYHTATLLADGKVLVAGGVDQNNNSLNSSELYDPATGKWTVTGNLNVARQSFSASILKDGKVLVTGGVTGNNSGSVSSAELYDPATGKWTLTGSMHYARFNQTETLLANGKVLVVAGNGDAQHVNQVTAELYDPASGQWSLTGSLHHARSNHTADLLSNGRVLVTGGEIVQNSHTVALSSAELYNPATGTWSVTGSLHVARFYQGDALLSNYTVLVAGGFDATLSSLATVEIYNPTSGKWTQVASMHNPRGGLTATLLPSGQVLAAGGGNFRIGQNLASAELYRVGK